MNQKVLDLISKCNDGEFFNKEEILYLLHLDTCSMEASLIKGAADMINRDATENKAEVHAQIGLNLSPCPMNCSFCAFASKNDIFNEPSELSVETIVQMAKTAEEKRANALYLMATADYSFSKFIEISKEVAGSVTTQLPLIANIGDFNESQAAQLKESGYTGIYHAIRMGEGTETAIDPERRWRTIHAAQSADLLIGTCVEPIGPEHSKDEIAEKILIGREIKPSFSGAMRRINIPGSTLECHGNLSEYELAYLVAVTRLAMGKNLRGNCTHEPNMLSVAAGASFLWAEVGTNPRDTKQETSESRGCDVFHCQNMLREAGWNILEGASEIFSKSNSL